jgi:hypothetical protein
MDNLQCKNCNEYFTGSYCPNCSQKVIELPHTFKSVFRYIISLFDFDSGFFHTLITLYLRPDRLINDYLSGKTKPYNNPVKFFFNTIGIVFLTEIIYRYLSSIINEKQFSLSEVDDQLTLIFNPGTLGGILIILVFNFLVSRSGKTLTEHIIISLYQMCSYVYLIIIVVQVWYILLGQEVLLYTIFMISFLGLTIRFHLKVFTYKSSTKMILKSFLFVMLCVIAFMAIIMVYPRGT